MNIIDRPQTGSTAARIECMPFSAWHGRLVVILGSAHLLDAFDATAISFVLPVLVGIWHLKPVEGGFLIASGYCGQFAGAILFGLFAGRFGRISALQASLVILALLSLCCALAPSYGVLLILRAAQGVGLGGETPIASTYMSEVCPTRFRGRMVVAIQMLFACGWMISAFTAFALIPRLGWRSMFFIGIAPIALAAAIRHLLPESPLWLDGKGRAEDANNALKVIEKAVYRDHRPSPTLTEFERWGTEEKTGGFSEIIAQPMLQRTLSAWMVAFCVSTAGYGVIGWMPTVYRTVYHLPLRTGLVYSFATSLLSLLGVLSAIFLIDWLGRKRAIISGFIGFAVLLGVLAAAPVTIRPIFVMLLTSVAFAFLALPLSGIYVYANELYAPGVRALGMGLASAWVRLAAILGPLIIGFILSYGSVKDVYVFLAAISLLGGFGMVLLGVETRTA